MQYFKRYYIVYAVLFSLVFGAGLLAAAQVRAISAAALQSAGTVLVIDPGHGGADGGAISPRGTKESALNLEISLRLWDLMTLLGADTVMLRTEDVSLEDDGLTTVSEKKVSDLKNRVKLVEHTPGALLISLHQNAYPRGPKYHGAQVFYAQTEGSKALAEQLQASVREHLDPTNHRAVKEAQHIYLMEHISCPGVLFECGFLTNAEEEARLRTPTYQKALVCVIAGCLTEYDPDLR